MLVATVLIAAALIAGICLTGSPGGEEESIREAMRDAVLHDRNKVAVLGMTVNPGLISAYTVTGLLLVAAALIRVFAVPRFKMVPGKFQMLLETLVETFDNLAKSNSPHRNGFLGTYIFGVGVYIFVSTMFELLGPAGDHHRRHVDGAAGAAVGHQRRDRDGRDVVSGDSLRRHRRQRPARRGQHAQGVLAADLDELSTFRRDAQRPARDRARV